MAQPVAPSTACKFKWIADVYGPVSSIDGGYEIWDAIGWDCKRAIQIWFVDRKANISGYADSPSQHDVTSSTAKYSGNMTVDKKTMSFLLTLNASNRTVMFTLTNPKNGAVVVNRTDTLDPAATIQLTP
jgi:hypothetical protein